jgi:hypothetical protein
MSRNAKMALGAIAALGLSLGAWRVLADHHGRASTVKAVASVTEPQLAAPSGPRAPEVVARAPERPHQALKVLPANTGNAVEVTHYELVSPDKSRPGESEPAKALRTQYFEKFEGFAKKAQISTEQRSKVLAVLADLQAENEYLEEQGFESQDLANTYVDAIKAISQDAADRLRKILTPDQLNTMDNYIGLDSLQAFVVAKPFDLQAQPTK